MNYDARGRPGAFIVHHGAGDCGCVAMGRGDRGMDGWVGVWTYVYCGRYYYFLQLLQRGIQSRKFQFAAR